MSRKKSNEHSRTHSRPEIAFLADRDLSARSFLKALRAAGLRVEDHNTHFAPDAKDEDWLPQAQAQGWVVLTHDKRMRLNPLAKEQILASDLRVFCLVGANLPKLAETFIRTITKVENFIAANPGPFFAKLYRPSERDWQLGRPGRIAQVLPERRKRHSSRP